MTLTITKILKREWYAGMLQDVVELDNGSIAKCNASLYRRDMRALTVRVYGVGKSGFAFAGKPVDWQPRIGDVVEIHPSQL